MEAVIREILGAIRERVDDHLKYGIIPFWMNRAVDNNCGGFLTGFDAFGRLDESDTQKYVVTQANMIWGLSTFSLLIKDNWRLQDAALQGVNFFIEHFWDRETGGWFWKVDRGGQALDHGKVISGQSAAILALAQYTLCSGDSRGLDYASRTFDVLQKYYVDTAHGGYYENLEPDWSLSAPGFPAGDRKTLDGHLRLLEAYCTLYQASHCELHLRRLQEVTQVILTQMIDPASGCGLNQFDLSFHPIPPIAIRRSWDADRHPGSAKSTGSLLKALPNTVSYGHNLELVWQLQHAFGATGQSLESCLPLLRCLSEHVLRYGVDWQRGGIFREGPYQGPALVRDKEWWQQATALVGLLAAYELTQERHFLHAFALTWDFADRYFIHPELGEWRTLLSETGEPLDPGLGSRWKACYQTGRAMVEVTRRINRILS